MNGIIGRLAQDRSLSLRAVGLGVWLAHNWEAGKPITAALLVSRGLGGRDALRAALAELRRAGYLIRSGNHLLAGWVGTGFSGSQGMWEPDSQAPMGTGISGPHLPEGVWEPSYQAPTGTGLSGSQPLSYVVGEEASSKDDADEQHHVKVGAAALDGSSSEREDSSIVTEEAAVTRCHSETIPWTEVHLLRSWFGIEQAERVQSWQAAWRTGISVCGDYDPQVHLVTYLTRCHEQKRDPQPGMWLRFMIEDRDKHIATMAEQARRMEQQGNGGEDWSIRSLKSTPDWSAIGQGGNQQ